MRKLGWLAIVVLVGSALPAVASGGGAGEDAGGLGKALITPAIGTFVWTLVTFLLMAFILARFAWKPLLGAIRTREDSIRDTIDQARKGRDDAEKLLEEHRALVAEARRERAEALAAGRRDAERIKEEILAQARQQREQMMQETKAQVEASMRQARAELRGAAADLAILAAEKLITERLDEAGHRRLVEDYLADLERSGAAPS